MSPPRFDVGVVGAGILGLACAEACAKDRLRVVIVSPNPIGVGATTASMGHIVVLDTSEPLLALTRYSQTLWRSRRSEFPANVHVRECGTIWVGRDEEDLLRLARMQRDLARSQVPASLLDSDPLAKLEPQFAGGLSGGIFVPEDLVLEPLAAAHHLWQSAQRFGARRWKPQKVHSIDRSRIRFAKGPPLEVEHVVIAAGIGSSQLIPGLPIRPRKGHLVQFAAPPKFIRHQLVEVGYLESATESESGSVAFVMQPGTNGDVIVGSSRQFGKLTADVEDRVVRQMLDRAAEFIPRVATLSPIREWAGFRPSTPDHLPYIGPLPDYPEVILATGHEGFGITTSLATGRLVSDLVFGRPSEISLEAFTPSHRNLRLRPSNGGRLPKTRPSKELAGTGRRRRLTQ